MVLSLTFAVNSQGSLAIKHLQLRPRRVSALPISGLEDIVVFECWATFIVKRSTVLIHARRILVFRRIPKIPTSDDAIQRS